VPPLPPLQSPDEDREFVAAEVSAVLPACLEAS